MYLGTIYRYNYRGINSYSRKKLKLFYAPNGQIVQRIKEKQTITEDKWIASDEATKKLPITSNTTL